MVTIPPKSRRALLLAVIVCILVVGTVIAGNDNVENDKLKQAPSPHQQRQLDERDVPFNDHDAAVLRKLISNKYIRFSNYANNNIRPEMEDSATVRQLTSATRPKNGVVPRGAANAGRDSPFARAIRKANAAQRTTHGRRRRHRTLKRNGRHRGGGTRRKGGSKSGQGHDE